jgi:hypothetical protein
MSNNFFIIRVAVTPSLEEDVVMELTLSIVFMITLLIIILRIVLGSCIWLRYQSFMNVKDNKERLNVYWINMILLKPVN